MSATSDRRPDAVTPAPDVTARLASWVTRRLTVSGSTRATGLLRIGLALIAWAEYAHQFRGFTDTSALRLEIGAVFYAASAAMLVGLWSRAATLLTGVASFVAYFALGRHGYGAEFLHHHTYALDTVLVVLALTPCGASYSLDRWLRVRRAIAACAPLPAESGPLWAVPLIALQVSAIYLGGAYDKVNPLFLGGTHLARLAAFYFGTHEGLAVPGFEPLARLLAVATIVLEVTLGLGLFVRRLQRVLMPVGIVFHALIYWSLPVSTFSMMMILLYVSYLPAGVVDRFTRMLDGTIVPGSGREPEAKG